MPSIIRWLLALLATAAFCLVSICFWDEPAAHAFITPGKHLHVLTSWLGSTSILAVTAIVTLLLVIRKVRGREISLRGHAVMVMGRAILGALTITAFILKPLFGRQPVFEYLYHREGSGFLFMHGSMASCFPSTHAAIAAAGIGVLWQIYPAHRIAWTGLLLMVSGVLIVGDWHFVSDVLAGVFIGATAAWLAGGTCWSRIPR